MVTERLQSNCQSWWKNQQSTNRWIKVWIITFWNPETQTKSVTTSQAEYCARNYSHVNSATVIIISYYSIISSNQYSYRRILRGAALLMLLVAGERNTLRLVECLTLRIFSSSIYSYKLVQLNHFVSINQSINYSCGNRVHNVPWFPLLQFSSSLWSGREGASCYEGTAN